MTHRQGRGLDLQPLSVAEGVCTDGAARAAELRRAILHTLVYSDLFDYPLTSAEIQRFLTACHASLDEVGVALSTDNLLGQVVQRSGRWYHLLDRSEVVARRRERAEASSRLWPVAHRFGAIIARLPFVHLVAATGALAMDNAPADDDVDLFLLVSPGRLWLCRLLVLVVVRAAAARGYELCPNFLLATNRLQIEDRNLFTAREVVQMVPLHVSPWYQTFLDANQWVRRFLPNALEAQPERRNGHAAGTLWPTRAGAALLATRLFDPLERWERERKIRRLTERARREGGSVAFTAVECRGHFGGHEQRVLARYAERVAAYEDLLEGR